MGDAINDFLGDSTRATVYRLGDWEVHPNACRVIGNGTEVKLSPRSMDVLVYLAERAGDVVTHEELIDAFWHGAISSPNAVHKCIAELRHAFGNCGGELAYIETVPKRGYRLVAPVSRIDANSDTNLLASASKSSLHEPIATTTNGTTHAPRPPARSRLFVVGVATTVLLVAAAASFDVGEMDHSASGRSSPKSLAVLRFRNVDQTLEHEYLGAGIANALTTQLSRAPGLAVASSERAFQHSVETESIQGIGKALDVQYVLDGSVQGSGDKLHASVVLYDARDGHQVYAYTHDEPFGRVLALQDKTIADVLSELEIQLDDRRAAEMRDWGTKNVKAYLAAVEGHVTRMRHDPISMRYGISLLRQAIQTDPAFVAAYEDLAAGLLDVTALSRDANLRESARQEVAQLRQSGNAN